MMNKVYDILVIGAGPSGLSVGIEAAKNDLSCLIIDRGSVVNTIRRYPTYAVFFSTAELLELNSLPFPSINKQPTRQEALRYYNKVAEYYRLQFKLYTDVTNIEKQADIFKVETNRGTYSAHHVVIAIGYYEKYNALNVPGEDLPHVSHFYTEPFAYGNQKVVVIGGSNSAAEAALDLHRNGADVRMVHRGAAIRDKIKYWLKPDLENRIKEGSIQAYFEAKVEAIDQEVVQIIHQGKTLHLPADHVIALTGYHPDVSFLAKAGVHYHPETYVPQYHPDTHETNVEGLYLAGTVTAGKNTSKIFIENSRHHGKKILHGIKEKELAK